MLEWLANFAQTFLGLFRFWVVINPYERALVLRLGKYSRELGPGLHWMWPLGIESELTANVVLETLNMGTQSLISRDGKPVLISVILTYRIRDLKKHLLETEDAPNVLEDSTYGVVGDAVAASDWSAIAAPEFATEVFTSVRRKAFRWGIEVLGLQFSDKTYARTFRLIQ